MSADPRALLPLAVLAALGAGPALAQFNASSLPTLLEADATAELQNYSGTKAKAVGFGARAFKLSSAPPVRYELVPGYAWYVAQCTTATPDTDKAPDPSGSDTEAAKNALRNGGSAGFQNVAPVVRSSPPPGFPFPNQRPVTDYLPARPNLPADYSLVMDLQAPLAGLSFMPRSGQAPDAFTAAWGTAAIEGRARVNAMPPQLANGPLPQLGHGVIVLAVTPSYHFKDVPYQVSAVLSAVMITNRNGVEGLERAKFEYYRTVVGHLTGGKWAQGSGLLFIPAPDAMSGACDRGVLRSAVGPDFLAAHGIQPGKAFEMNVAGTVFVRTTPPPN